MKPSLQSLLSLVAALVLGVVLTACDEDTAMIGSDIMPGKDHVEATESVFRLTSRSIPVDSVRANTANSYLGCIVDPETQSKTTCSFLAQFHMTEDYRFPAKDLLQWDEQGTPVVDSCDIRLFFDQYYGDSLAVMKLHVQELDTARTLQENVAYYSNLNPEEFINPSNTNHFTYAYAASDLARPGATNPSILVRLPKEYGQFIIKKYYENPDFFKNSYNFIHHVCPGFYFKTTGSVGSMVNTYISTLDVFFKYKMTTEAGTDTLVSGMHRMAATEEVIQSTSVENRIPDGMLDPANEYTYLKSPTGIFTEVTLPVGDVVAGEHYNDTINSAQIIFRCFASEAAAGRLLSVPQNIVMVRKADMYKFFEKENLPDSKTSYISVYDASNNAYSFANIGQLLTILKNERDAGAGVVRTESEEVRNAKYAQWEAANPDWNKVILIPVQADYTTTTNIYGVSTKTLQRVRNLMGMTSVKIEGGANAAPQMSVVYSRFKK